MQTTAASQSTEIGRVAKFLSEHKRGAYLVSVLLISWATFLLHYILGDMLNVSASIVAWLFPFIVFVIIPILDYTIGEDPLNIDVEEESLHAEDKYYRVINILVLPIYAFMLVWGMRLIANGDYILFQTIGWMVSIGTIGGAVGIVHAHELVHKSTKYEQITGGLILSLVSYASFKIEHVYGHHLHVSTTEDASSSRYNQSLYEFLPNAYKMNFVNAWKIQKKRMKKKDQAFWSFKNELLNYYLLTLGVLLAFIIWQGWLGAVYFIVTSFVAITLLEIVNYLEHYGLHREQKEDGSYERVRPEHSWNSNHIITNLLLVNLQRHSDHHAKANRRYQILRNFENLPQLPSGYASMIVLAVFPPLWKKVMNPRVEAYYKDRQHLLITKKS